MARLIGKMFYDEISSMDFLNENPWIEIYYENCRKVVEYLKSNGAKTTLYYSTVNSLKDFRDYLIQQNKSYDRDVSFEWYNKTKPYPSRLLSALIRLADVYEFGEIQSENAYPFSCPYYSKLNYPWKNETDRYLNSLNMKDGSKLEIRNCISRFLYYIQEYRIQSPDQITYEIIEHYINIYYEKSYV